MASTIISSPDQSPVEDSIDSFDPMPAAADAAENGNRLVHIPVPRRQALEAICSLTRLIGDRPVPIYHLGQQDLIGYRLAETGMTVLGTGCRRPLLCEEAQELRAISGDHMLIVRIEDEAHGFGPLTLDILMSGSEHWLTRYRLWQIHPTTDVWMVPSQGEGRSIRFVSRYLAASPRAPFFNLFEREHGFATAAVSLAAVQGGK